MWASEHFGVTPDIMTSGKAIAGGLPMSAIISTREIMSKWLPGMHGSTFGGHPVAAAGALAVLDAIKEENILENVNKMGAYLRERLAEMQKKFPIMGDVRGLGLMTAVEFIHPEDKRPNGEGFSKLRKYALENKLLLLGCGVYGNGLRFATPLNVTKEDLDKGLAIIEKGLATI
jgi:4-aminobutyrate aminotransferase